MEVSPQKQLRVGRIWTLNLQKNSRYGNDCVEASSTKNNIKKTT